MQRIGKKPNCMTVAAAIKEMEKIEMTRQTDGVYRLDHAVTAMQADVITTKMKYDEETDRLKELLDRRKELQAEELLTAVMKSSRSYEDIFR